MTPDAKYASVALSKALFLLHEIDVKFVNT